MKKISKLTILIGMTLLTVNRGIADLGESQKQVDERYARDGEEASTKRADPPAETLTTYKLGRGQGADYVQVWFRDGKSCAERHISLQILSGGIRDEVVDSLRRRNAEDSSWIAVELGGGLLWKRKDGKAAAWVVFQEVSGKKVKVSFCVASMDLIEKHLSSGAEGLLGEKREERWLWKALEGIAKSSGKVAQ